MSVNNRATDPRATIEEGGSIEVARGVEVAAYEYLWSDTDQWIRVVQFTRSPDGEFYVSGFGSNGLWADSIHVPYDVEFAVR